MTTANKFLDQPARGSDVGVWDTPVNANSGIIDNSFGGLATIALGAAPVILSSGQYQCVFLNFTGALTANVSVQFPAVGSFYSIINDTTNSSNFTVIATCAGGGNQIGLPTGTVTEILTDGTNARFRGLPDVGNVVRFAGAFVPNWINQCTVPPFLYCDGSAFSAVTYPRLAVALGGTTLPDLRGRYDVPINDGTGRIGGAVDGNTNLATGGANNFTIGQNNIPNYDLTVNDPGHVHDIKTADGTGALAGPAEHDGATRTNRGNTWIASNTTGITVNSNGNGDSLDFLPPTQVVGIAMIRAG